MVSFFVPKTWSIKHPLPTVLAATEHHRMDTLAQQLPRPAARYYSTMLADLANTRYCSPPSLPLRFHTGRADRWIPLLTVPGE